MLFARLCKFTYMFCGTQTASENHTQIFTLCYLRYYIITYAVTKANTTWTHMQHATLFDRYLQLPMACPLTNQVQSLPQNNAIITLYNLQIYFLFISKKNFVTTPTLSSVFARPPVACRCLLSDSTVGSRAFPVAGPRIWNALPQETTSAQSLSLFRQRLKSHLFRQSYPDLVI